MAKINCSKCIHFFNNSCTYEFRYAAGAVGQEIDDCDNVYFCRDFNEIEVQEDFS